MNTIFFILCPQESIVIEPGYLYKTIFSCQDLDEKILSNTDFKGDNIEVPETDIKNIIRIKMRISGTKLQLQKYQKDQKDGIFIFCNERLPSRILYNSFQCSSFTVYSKVDIKELKLNFELPKYPKEYYEYKPSLKFKNLIKITRSDGKWNILNYDNNYTGMTHYCWKH